MSVTILAPGERFADVRDLARNGHQELAGAALARRVGNRRAAHVLENLAALVNAIGYRTEETCAIEEEWRRSLIAYTARRYPCHLKAALAALYDE